MASSSRHRRVMEQYAVSCSATCSGAQSDEATEYESRLVIRARKGDEAAFSELLDMYQRKIFNFVLSRVRNRETAEDVTQEVLVKAYFNLPKLKDLTRFRSWLFSIASNHLKDMMRRRKLPTVEDNNEPPSRERYVEEDMTDEAVHEESRARLLRQALERLTIEQRSVLTLCDIEGFSYREISQIMKIPLGTVQSRIFYARKKLREILEKEFDFKGDDYELQRD